MSKRILIVDDEFMVALSIADTVERGGHEVVGPYSSAEQALEALRQDKPDAALLDYDLGRGRTSEGLAAALTEAGVPFAFLTGYSKLPNLPETLGRAPCLSKPCDPPVILGMLGELLSQSVG